MTKWESEKHKCWCMPAEGFKGHVTTDGSSLGKAGKWGARGWAEVPLEIDDEMVQWRQNTRSSAPSRGQILRLSHAFSGK